MKSVGKLLRTLSGDGMSPRRERRNRSPLRNKSRSPRRNRTMESRPNSPPPNDAQLYCSDMYSEDYVRDSIDAVAIDIHVDTIVLEDLIERNNARLTKAVLDLFVNTTQSESLDAQQQEQEQQSTELKQSTELRGSSNTSSTTSSSTFMRSSTGSSLTGSFSRKKSSKQQQNLIQKRVWKSILFVDCISDGDSYQAYLDQKREFVASLTRFLRMKGFQNDLPIRFNAKIEIHTLLEAPTILQLLQAIQQDDTVTRVEFGGALRRNERRVPEEFEKLIDPDTLTVKEIVKIHLHYDKQSLNITEEDIMIEGPSKGMQGAQLSARKGKQRRGSQLDPGVLMTLQRCALMLERKMTPNGSLFMDASDLSDIMDGSARSAPSYTIDSVKPFDFDSSEQDHSGNNEVAVFSSESSKFMTDSSEPGTRSSARQEESSPNFRRAHTDGAPRTAVVSRYALSPGNAPVKRAVSVDETFWDKGLDSSKQDAGSSEFWKAESIPTPTPSSHPTTSPTSNITSAPTRSSRQQRIANNNNNTNGKHDKLDDSSIKDSSDRSNQSRKKSKKKKKEKKDNADDSHSDKSTHSNKSTSSKSRKKKKKDNMDDSSKHSDKSTSSSKTRKKKKKDNMDDSSEHSNKSTSSKSRKKKHHIPDNPKRSKDGLSTSDHSTLPRDADGLKFQPLKRTLSDTPPKKEPVADPPGLRKLQKAQSFSGRGSMLVANPNFDWNGFLGESTPQGLIDP